MRRHGKTARLGVGSSAHGGVGALMSCGSGHTIKDTNMMGLSALSTTRRLQSLLGQREAQAELGGAIPWASPFTYEGGWN